MLLFLLLFSLLTIVAFCGKMHEYKTQRAVFGAESHKIIFCFNRRGKIVFQNCKGNEVFSVFTAPPQSLSDLQSIFPELKMYFQHQRGRSFQKDLSVKNGKDSFFCSIHEIGRKTWIFIDPRRSEERVVEMGKSFIANASHELRTPITIIKGFTETLSDIEDISPEMFSTIIEKIQKNCVRMEQIVKNLLILADLDRNPVIEKDICNVTLMLEDVARQVIDLYPEITIEQTCDCENMEIEGDRSLLEIALMNILKNAAKYSFKGGKIDVSASSSKKGVCIQIADFGIGMKKEELSRIFDRFYSVDKAHSRKLGGTGLGLSIVKMIMDKHGGEISVQSKEGFGTTFTLLFPANATVPYVHQYSQ